MKRQYQFILTTVLLVMTAIACKPENAPAGLALMADKESIVADGKDAINFQVKYNGTNVTGDAIISVDGHGAVENASFSTYEVGELRATAMYKGKTSELLFQSISPEGTIIVADKSEIEANGFDKATLTVLYDGKDVTTEAVIKDGDGSSIGGNTFTATKTGSYTFTAEYLSHSGNSVSISARTPDLVLSADKYELWPDGKDKSILSVSLDGEDVTSSSEIYFSDGRRLDGSSFSTDKEKEVMLYAKNSKKVSNWISINASSVRLVFDKKSVPEAAGQKVSMRVMKGEENISEESKVKYLRNDEYLQPDGDSFSFVTTDMLVDEFVAEYGDKTITARLLKEPDGEFHKNIAITKCTGTWCGWCHPGAVELEKAIEQGFSGSVVTMNAHGGDIMATEEINGYIGILNELAGYYQGTVFPLISFDYRNYYGNKEASVYINELNEAIGHNARCGLSLDSRIEGNTVTANVSLWSVESTEFFVKVCLLEDGIIADQTSYITEGEIIKDYVHNDVIRSMQTPDLGASWGVIEKYDQKSREFSFDASSYDISKCSLAVIATIKEGDIKVATNAIRCKAGESVGFIKE